ncbi:mycoredoxin [Austwickia chelonae]|uniref:Glutaredoxin domain-containing protein n=1 Tax=Austwickia chelonae NBRC 105200 TaxID=1184607 RepID=K6WAI8_9MICO|nr:glutaredoxin domain-containing protein [Austwickia chelonae]GAB78857.1 hypothetical protein AUCHE_17_00690 [Austwickia chelonae NBRC 105200]SEV85399.1 mycoredoxin [Austwickia chelonae]
MRTRWLLPGFCALLGLIQVVSALRGGHLLSLVPAALLLALAVLLAPARLPVQVDQDGARHAVEQGKVVIYHRAGCPYCLRLQRSLGADLRAAAVWVDIWADPQAAAFVRSVTGGDETVPTVVIDGVPVVNPPPATVVQALRG